jgi:hypothetical protein
MTTALKFYNKYSKSELIEIARMIEINEDNHEPPGTSIHKLKPAPRKTMAEIDQAITWHMDDDRKIAGNPVTVCGYSGSQTNRAA